MTEADLILKNARVITVDTHCPMADFVAVKGDRILFAGDSREIDSVTGPGTKTIDCAGKTIVPGFIDAHCHIFSFFRKILSVDLSTEKVQSIADIKTAIREAVKTTPPGEWIDGADYNEFYLKEKRHPTRHDIDEVAPDHPVVLSHQSLHACVLNSKALELAGITRETEEPPGGTIVREYDTGEPGGLLIDMLGYIREQVMPGITREKLERGVRLANRHYLSRGITSLQDATVVNDMGRWHRFEGFKDSRLFQPRVYLMAGYEYLDEFIRAGLPFGYGNAELKLGHVKITPSESEGNKVFPPPEELNRMVLKIHRSGFRAAIHAVRMETVEAAVTAICSALEQQPVSDHRHRLEHCSECPPELLEQIRKAGICIATQPPFVHYSGERYLATVEPERLPWLYRIKSLLNAGVIVAGSSDSPIVNDNPLMGIYAAVTRKAKIDAILQPEERISPLQALTMYTLNAARVSFDEAIKGSISPGKLADMVLLSGDPTSVPPEQIKDITVEMTILGGNVVWEN
ncbi:MAG: amidohydrolase [Dehalococcoidales bacterium]|nr:amidohydrolase [Dehalococcoidales bacterium]